MRTKLIPIIYMVVVLGIITYVNYCGSEKNSSKPESVVKKEITDKLHHQLEPDKVFKNSYINLAFFGLDKTDEREKTLGCFRTDTIIIMRLDLQKNKVFMLSIPRDTYVFIPAINRMDKINHALPYGGGEEGNGFDSSIDTIENFLGIKIDHYIGMDMEAIVPIVDAVEGVKIAVDLDYDRDGCRLIKDKTQILDGKMAFHYVHYRYTARGDIDRVERQQKFIKSFLKTANNGISMEKAIDNYMKLKSMFYTDMTLSQITSLGYYFKTLDPESIDSNVISGNFMNINGISYWNPNMPDTKAIVDDIFLANNS